MVSTVSHLIRLSIVSLVCLSALAFENPDELAAERLRVQERFPEAFSPVTDDPDLPRVLLLGDSISIGYTVAVRQMLRGVANVHRIPENGGPTSRGLQQLDEWLGERKWDLIHFNFGLHDLARVNADEPRNPPDVYERNLRELTERLQATGARLVFATTTPVPGTTPSPPRRESDVIIYNEAAVRIMRDCSVPVNDLHAYVVPRLKEIQLPGNVHFTEEGYGLLAEPVARSIRENLQP